MLLRSSVLALSLALVACGNGREGEPAPQPADLRAEQGGGMSNVPLSSNKLGEQPVASAPAQGTGTSKDSSAPANKIPASALAGAAAAFELPERRFETPIRNLWATYYYTPRFTHAADGYDLLDMNGRPLGPRLSHRQWCDAAMEGSVQIFFAGQWTTYNFATSTGTVQVDCSRYFKHQVGRTRFKVARGPFGDGVQRYILSPFRTIAVDPDVIPYGTAIYIPSARGLPFNLPTGERRIHDGYFFAADTGGLIHGNHIDVFLGIESKTPFSWITSRSDATVDFQIVPDTDVREALLGLHQ